MEVGKELGGTEAVGVGMQTAGQGRQAGGRGGGWHLSGGRQPTGGTGLARPALSTLMRHGGGGGEKREAGTLATCSAPVQARKWL